MGLIDQARTDVKNYTSNTSLFGVSAIFTAPNASTATVVVIHTKHHTSLNDEGEIVSGKRASITVAEDLLIAAGYIVRNAAGEVYMDGHRVDVEDSTGTSKKYLVEQWFPDETLGIITLILGDFE